MNPYTIIPVDGGTHMTSDGENVICRNNPTVELHDGEIGDHVIVSGECVLEGVEEAGMVVDSERHVELVRGESDWHIVSGRDMTTSVPDTTVFLPESDDLSHFEGDTGQWDIQSGTTRNNDYALECEDNIDSSHITSHDGLEYYPRRGDRIGLDVRGNVQAIWFYFGVDATESGNSNLNTADDKWYRVALRPDQDSLQISGHGESASTSLIVEQGEWSYLLIDWGSDGEILLRWYDSKPLDPPGLRSPIESISIVSSDAHAGGIAFGSTRNNSDNNQAWYENVEVAKGVV